MTNKRMNSSAGCQSGRDPTGVQQALQASAKRKVLVPERRALKARGHHLKADPMPSSERRASAFHGVCEHPIPTADPDDPVLPLWD